MTLIAILASHAGSILQAVLDARAAGALDAKIVLVISNNSGSGALRRATGQGLPTLHLSSATHPDPASLDTAMCQALEAARPDWVLLAGYMKQLGPATLAAFRNRILNAHPALLPKHGGKGMYGRRVHQAVIDAGDTESGATVHIVDGDYDTGPILAQVRVPVRPSENAAALEERVQIAERRLVVETLRALTPRRRAAG